MIVFEGCGCGSEMTTLLGSGRLSTSNILTIRPGSTKYPSTFRVPLPCSLKVAQGFFSDFRRPKQSTIQVYLAAFALSFSLGKAIVNRLPFLSLQIFMEPPLTEI